MLSTLQNAKSHQLLDLLKAWWPLRDQGLWILGSVYKLEGSAYRKPGSFMLMNDEGVFLGLLSGGCLESDLIQKARSFASKIEIDNLGNSESKPSPAMSIRYDSSDEDDTLFQLGLGCGGIVDILLQPLHSNNNYLELEQLIEQLSSFSYACYEQHLSNIPATKKTSVQSSYLLRAFNMVSRNAVSRNTVSRNAVANDFEAIDNAVNASPAEKACWLREIESSPFKARALLIQSDSFISQYSYLPAPPHLVVFGGGVDALPLCTMARQMGWLVTLVDARPSHARAEHFGIEIEIIKKTPQALSTQMFRKNFQAAIIMNHSVDMDAESLAWLQQFPLQYCAMLGPQHRCSEVLERAGLEQKKLPWPLNTPAGFDIGADLPESIALSILAQCHQHIYQSAPINQPLSDNRLLDIASS